MSRHPRAKSASTAAASAAASVPVLLVPERLSDRLRGWARAGYPLETCGLLVGRVMDGHATRVLRVVLARNLDRERPADRYELDPRDFLAVYGRARRDGTEVLGVWHSHPDHPAAPSAVDLASAWEGYSYVILSTGRDGVSEIRSWRLVAGSFVEQAIGDRSNFANSRN